MGADSPRLLHQGLVRIGEYEALLEDDSFTRMETFSDSFISRHREALSSYGRRWVADPFHQWSRQWEYPFVYSAVTKAAAGAGDRPLRILDAGSGITFFPYYLALEAAGAEVTCCDHDPLLQKVFAQVNGKVQRGVGFVACDLVDTGLEEGAYDVVYCISVLEHSRRRSEIIGELSRLLAPGGLLILTFDISLDGLGEVPPKELKQMVAELEGALEPTDRESINRLLDLTEICHERNVTTLAVPRGNRSLLPWKYPFASTLLAALRRGKIPRHRVRNFTFSCHVFEKRPPGFNGGSSSGSTRSEAVQ